jgi:transcriptional regulator with XRE-family HTH domain
MPRKRPVPIEGPDDAPGAELGEKIEWLIRHRWPDDAPAPATNADVAAAVEAATGEELSSTGIWKLRTGRGVNPTLKTMTALAAFFRVPIGFFGDDEEAEAIADGAAAAALLRDNGVSRAALRAFAGLSAPGQRVVEDLIDSMTRMEHERGEEQG